MSIKRFSKLFGAAVVATVVAGAVSTASAIEMSAGIGGIFSNDFRGGLLSLYGTEKEDDKEYKFTSNETWSGGGFGVFFDATYAEVGVGMTFGGTQAIYGFKGISFTALNLGLAGKYPIAIADNVTFFPLLGIDYMMVLAATTKYVNSDNDQKWDGKKETKTAWNGEEYEVENPKAGDLSRLGFRLGFGMDIDLNETMFLRNVISYNLRLANKFNKDEVDEWKKESDEPEVDVNAGLSHGLSVSLSLGFRF